MPTPPDGEFTELVDATIPRVDLVDKAANGTSFLIAKAADGSPAGLINPDIVRGLIGKAADPKPEPAGDTHMTLRIDGLPDAETLADLVGKAIGRPAADPSIVKEAAMATPEDLDPTVVLAEPAEDAPGDVNTPGSPAWEAVDAATARKWTSILSRAKSALGVMADRELLEAAGGDPDDFDSALNLDDAACAIDYAISVLAPFAVDEEAEVIQGTADLEAVGKALTGLLDPLEVIESLGQVRKAGRSLSSANEQAIRSAVESLQKVLASLPAAPDTQESGLPVAKKETDMPETPEIEPATVEPVGKADGEGKPPMVAVYDAKGKLVGIVDPGEITPISGADATEDTSEEAPAAAEAAPEAAADDLAPAPADAVGTPADEDVAKEADATTDDTATGDDVTKTTDTDSDDILKSSRLTELVKSIVGEQSAGHTAQLTTQGEAIVELAELVETLKGQVVALEEQPAQPGVFANGATPPAHLMRGQDMGAPPVDMAKARELKRTMYAGSAPEQNAAAVEMQSAAIEALKAIHRGA
jgi:hypothetical protein